MGEWVELGRIRQTEGGVTTVVELDQLKRAVHKADPSLEDDDEAFRAAVVLLAASHTGPSRERVRKFTGYDEGFVNMVAGNLKASGIWGRRLIHASDWDDEETGGLAFWMDVAVGLGHLARVPG